MDPEFLSTPKASNRCGGIKVYKQTKFSHPKRLILRIETNQIIRAQNQKLPRSVTRPTISPRSNHRTARPSPIDSSTTPQTPRTTNPYESYNENRSPKSSRISQRFRDPFVHRSNSR
uniref:Uncharacterized protein n=1 Tax=Arundo donax TaxID=35708 RepID=A0A0A9EW61_ARUDO